MVRHLALAGAALLLLALGGCGTLRGSAAPPRPVAASPSGGAPAAGAQRRGGAYYEDDGPGDHAPPNLEQTPDAVPRDEPPLKTAANRPYVVFGKTYAPTVGSRSFRQRGVASWYGRKFHGQKTSSGEPYDMYGMSAAHPTLPIPSYVRVTNLANGRTVVVRVNDRGPFHSDRIIDLSYTAALRLGYVNQGSTQVEIEQVHDSGDLAPAAPLLARSPPPAAPAQPPAPPVDAPPAIVPGAFPPVAAVVTTAPAASPVRAPQSGAGGPAVTAAGPAPVSLATSQQPDGVYLQLGAFGGRDGAEEFRIKVYQQLGWLTQTIYIVARDRLFRVQLGPYKDRGEAAGVAEKIRETLQFAPVFVLK